MQYKCKIQHVSHRVIANKSSMKFYKYYFSLTLLHLYITRP